MTEYICRVCGMMYDIPTWDDESGGSYDICNCCGVEFGIQDCLHHGIIEYREEWISKGANWFSPEKMPENWDLAKQLSNIPIKWR